mmetsp:Transcript_19778/g.37159  ORF Transcript_19778/g.37159 Transcript_19778/m.37159 type:complete len:352 (+) Transcript_19778:2838-3893(+)
MTLPHRLDRRRHAFELTVAKIPHCGHAAHERILHLVPLASLIRFKLKLGGGGFGLVGNDGLLLHGLRHREALLALLLFRQGLVQLSVRNGLPLLRREDFVHDVFAAPRKDGEHLPHSLVHVSVHFRRRRFHRRESGTVAAAGIVAIPRGALGTLALDRREPSPSPLELRHALPVFGLRLRLHPRGVAEILPSMFLFLLEGPAVLLCRLQRVQLQRQVPLADLLGERIGAVGVRDEGSEGGVPRAENVGALVLVQHRGGRTALQLGLETLREGFDCRGHPFVEGHHLLQRLEPPQLTSAEAFHVVAYSGDFVGQIEQSSFVDGRSVVRLRPTPRGHEDRGCRRGRRSRYYRG